jgi:phage-related minor tail protein
VEKERGAQDALLRDMRQMALNAESGQVGGGGGAGSPLGGMAPSYSSANMMNAPASTSKPAAGRVGKR